MKTASRTPEVSALVESIANGENHESSGLIEPAGAVPAHTRVRATTAKMPSVTTSAVSSHCCVLALSSMPMTQIHVMIAIQTTPMIVTAHIVSAADCQPNSRNV